MPFELFVASRYLFARRKQAFIYVISLMSILGVALGVAALVVVLGVYNGLTTGTPICIVIPNTAQRSEDYTAARGPARPGHADYTAYAKYHGYEDFRGGGHFSGRITAALVAAGALIGSALEKKGLES